LLIVILGSYAVYVINSLKRSIDAEKELFRDYKRDVALVIQELIEKKNECMSRLDKMCVELEHICREHEKNHG
jgi:flagellar biosynthesis/type III secretory pathway chaperone